MSFERPDPSTALSCAAKELTGLGKPSEPCLHLAPDEREGACWRERPFCACSSRKKMATRSSPSSSAVQLHGRPWLLQPDLQQTTSHVMHACRRHLSACQFQSFSRLLSSSVVVLVAPDAGKLQLKVRTTLLTLARFLFRRSDMIRQSCVDCYVLYVLVSSIASTSTIQDPFFSYLRCEKVA